MENSLCSSRPRAGSSDKITMAQALGAASGRLRAAGIDQPGLDARLLLGHALDIDQTEVILRHNDLVEAGAERRFESFVTRRADREPVSRITGKREFYGRTFRLAPEVLDPRADTETLVDAALALCSGRQMRLLDLGTGSGAIVLTLLAEWPEATGVGVDFSAGALYVAARNGADIGVSKRLELVCSDWDAALAGKYDLIVCNPPYIPSARIERLDSEVASFDPRLALDGGPDGFDAIRALAKLAPRRLAEGGYMLVEVGCGQAGEAISVFSAAGLVCGPPRPDLAGIHRVITAQFTSKTGAAGTFLGLI